MCRERGLATIVNIHDGVLATEFWRRIVGRRAGEIVCDGPAATVDHAMLTRIDGDEDWTAITPRMDRQRTGPHAVDDTDLAVITVFRRDINIRESAVLGPVGAWGIDVKLGAARGVLT